jgi:hypothetical protein
MPKSFDNQALIRNVRAVLLVVVGRLVEIDPAVICLNRGCIPTVVEGKPRRTVLRLLSFRCRWRLVNAMG